MQASTNQDSNVGGEQQYASLTPREAHTIFTGLRIDTNVVAKRISTPLPGIKYQLSSP
jgi:hypothetical protein